MTPLVDQLLHGDDRLMPTPTLLRAAEHSTVYRGVSKVMVREYWLLELVISGAFSVNVEETDWRTCGKHQGVLYSPQTRCRECSDDKIPPNTITRSLCLEFDVANCEFLYELFEENQQFLWLLDMDESLEKLLGLIVYRTSSNLDISSASIYAIGIFYQILSLLLSSDKKSNKLVIHHDDYPIPDVIMKAHL